MAKCCKKSDNPHDQITEEKAECDGGKNWFCAKTMILDRLCQISAIPTKICCEYPESENQYLMSEK
jgi:hypothetical protein